ncbi:hypothetical protein [Amycolatopsis sp. NPDC059657]|uniref:hypothetical protein n=1 Tax=Amycolatopsis sp. NPDC059657 TaxID=3346899 RepID=UPI00366BE0A4
MSRMTWSTDDEAAHARALGSILRNERLASHLSPEQLITKTGLTMDARTLGQLEGGGTSMSALHLFLLFSQVGLAPLVAERRAREMVVYARDKAARDTQRHPEVVSC